MVDLLTRLTFMKIINKVILEQCVVTVLNTYFMLHEFYKESSFTNHFGSIHQILLCIKWRTRIVLTV